MIDADLLLTLPLLLPLLAGIVCLFFWKARTLQRIVTISSMAILLACTLLLVVHVDREGVVATNVGSWQAPFGIVLLADRLSATMLLLGAIVGLAAAIYSPSNVGSAREAQGYSALLNLLLVGVGGAFLTGDLFNLFVWFEVLLIVSFVLMALGGERPQLEGATKYVTLNLISSALLLMAIGTLYSIAGTLNMADLALRMNEIGSSKMVDAVGMLFLVTFSIKSAVFPLFFWLPASYHTPPTVVSAVFAGLLTKVGVYALLRTFTLIFTQNTEFTHTIIIALSGLTMLTGVLGALAQSDLRRILSFHIISQIGYMTMGLGLFSKMAIAGSIFYIAHHIIVKTNLFLVCGVAERLLGTSQLKEMGGLYETRPLLTFTFAVAAFSLAGVPPLSGFWAKLFLIRAGMHLEQFVIVAVALAVGLLTLFSMTKAWKEAFWQEPPTESSDQANVEERAQVGWMMAPVVALALLSVSMGLIVAPLLDFATQAAEQLLSPEEYIQTALEGRP